jgi:hypothetical protein
MTQVRKQIPDIRHKWASQAASTFGRLATVQGVPKTYSGSKFVGKIQKSRKSYTYKHSFITEDTAGAHGV